MKLLYYLCLLLCWGPLLQAQHDPEHTLSPWSARFNFPALADPIDMNFSAGAEYQLNPSLSVTADVAYIFFSHYLNEYNTASGMIFRPGLRYYTSDKHTWYVEAVPFYKQVGYTMEGWLGKDCIDGVPVYEQYQRFTYRKRVLAFNLQAGAQVPVSKNKLWRLEFYAGLSVRAKWLDVKNEPDACYRMANRFTLDPHTNPQVVPGLPGGMRLVYVFAKDRAAGK